MNLLNQHPKTTFFFRLKILTEINRTKIIVLYQILRLWCIERNTCMYFSFCYTELSIIEKVYSYWVRGQKQFCLTRGRICCPKQQASKVKQNCYCPRTQSITVLLCTFIFFFKIVLFHWLIKTPSIHVRQVWEYGRCHYFLLWHCDV